ncbi:hypothetical protein P171DRAFT_522223 [Karstenula rhodostoma CBS 690.94]|uniref:Rhodopsin domain-containing protein n=1 Tax=Karstenula rhodostoma CBS 690.94 TaxID=1392251 RepID=A0A9P4PEU1_9PLEO|nr:hypothetical protein P171DRAFT_522223 [Karstenula rhodostoma CBS 690.94]
MLIYPAKRPPQDTANWSIRDLRSVSADTGFFPRYRAQTAVTLASSVLQLHETPWLGLSWTNEDKRLSEMHRPEDGLLETGGARIDLMTENIIANRLVDELYDHAGEKYAGAVQLEFGLGLHCEDIAQHNRDGGIDYDRMTHDYFILLYPDMWLYTAAMGLSKTTALALYWRLFGKSTTQYWILLLVGCVVWWMFARFVVILAICNPVPHFWDRQGSGHCSVDMAQFFYSSTVSDWNLTPVCMASLIQLILATQLNTSSQELWWINTPQAIAAIVEINLAHFSTSLPNLRPVLRCLKGGGVVRKEPARGKDSTGLSRPSNAHTAVSSEANFAQTREQGYEGLVAHPEHVVSVDRETNSLRAYGRPFSRTEIASLRNFQVEPPSDLHSLMSDYR